MWIVFQVVINWIKWLDYRLNMCKNTGYRWHEVLIKTQQLVYIAPRLELGADPHSSPFCILHATESLWYRTHRHVLTSLHLTAATPSLFYRSPKHMGGCLLSFFLFLWRGNVPFVCLRWKWSEMHLGYCQGPRTFSGFDTRNRYYHYNGIL